ncbi:MAG: ABC transporter substrate-binding protein, partial [Anaerolineaceae bacterium]
DRQALVDTILLGQGRPATHGYPHPDSPWTNPVNVAAFDIARARMLLDEAGLRDRDGDGIREFADGRKLELTLNVAATEPAQIRAAELVARQLRAVGVGITVRSLDPTVITSLFASRNFDLYITEIGPHGAADPDQFVESQRSGYLWKSGLAYPEMDALVRGYAAAPTKESRRAVLFRMQTLFNARPTSLALYYPDERWAFRPGPFNGWVESPGFGIVQKWSFLPPAARQGVMTTDLRK